jgi:TatD DNase family protein
MKTQYIDTHAHLSRLPLDEEKSTGYITGLFANSFSFILDVGTAAGDLAGRVRRFAQFSGMRFAAGIWPHAQSLIDRNALCEQLEKDIDAAPAGALVAVGECGFDRKENPAAPREERELLELQLDIARRKKLPIIIHSREAAPETIETLNQYDTVCGIIHCFSYSRNEAMKFLDLGYYISFAGNLTYKNAQNLRDTLPYIPKDRLLLETDCPYLSPVPYRGKPCLPDMICETYAVAAKLLNCDTGELKSRIAANVSALFGV